MDFFQNIEHALDNLWQPVLKPPRRPICNDTLGFKYVSTLNESIYRRRDGVLKTKDKVSLRYTCYLKLPKEESTLSQSSFSARNSRPRRPVKKPLLAEVNSIDGKITSPLVKLKTPIFEVYEKNFYLLNRKIIFCFLTIPKVCKIKIF